MLDDFLVAGVGHNGQLVRQQEIAAVTFCYFHHIAANAERRDIFFQDDFHDGSIQNSFPRIRTDKRG